MLAAQHGHFKEIFVPNMVRLGEAGKWFFSDEFGWCAPVENTGKTLASCFVVVPIVREGAAARICVATILGATRPTNRTGGIVAGG